jgi:hypothetical protein
VHAVLQHTPSTQNVLVHCVPLIQGAPLLEASVVVVVEFVVVVVDVVGGAVVVVVVGTISGAHTSFEVLGVS